MIFSGPQRKGYLCESTFTSSTGDILRKHQPTTQMHSKLYLCQAYMMTSFLFHTENHPLLSIPSSLHLCRVYLAASEDWAETCEQMCMQGLSEVE